MAFTTTDLAALDSAIASGELTIRTNDRQVTYRSIDELKTARELVVSGLAAQAATSRLYPRHQLADFSEN